ncbi:hypothetical protein C8E87_1892 [Paractinoplanes brasiliensis]|uniref:Uncharacterized protein n=2 Tax=Paractinoplanes brasiliensis TaxID=52695 RepID=A0A4R6JR96_9ACTN|nr:hypothetical protein C8E87_1892 [Actinoplanes brasiliensis]
MALEVLAKRGIQVSPYQLERWRARGLVPRNDRRGLGRGFGTYSVPSADLVSSLETIACAGVRRTQVEWQVLVYMHRMAKSSDGEDRLARLAERPIRRCLEYAVLHERPAGMNEDDAYREAANLALEEFNWWLPRVPRGQAAAHYEPTELREMRAACEQVLAADRIGVLAVGSELLVESVIRLRWARTEAEAETLVDYLDLVLNRRREHLDLARSVPYDQLLGVATKAARVAAFGSTFPDRLENSRFSWLPYPGYAYSGWLVLLMAMLMDSSLVAAASGFLSSHPEDPEAERRRSFLEKHVADLRGRFPDGIPPKPKRSMLVGLEEFVDPRTGKWR